MDLHNQVNIWPIFSQKNMIPTKNNSSRVTLEYNPQNTELANTQYNYIQS